MKIRLALFFLTLFLLPASAVMASSPQMMLHKALYDVKLTSARNGAVISDVQGEMFFEWNRNCEAWVTDHRSYLTYQYTDGNTARITTDFVTYESLDGKSLSFTSKRTKDGVVYEQYRGSVELDSKGLVQVDYKEPDFLDPVFIPKETFFPMHHTLAMLQKASSGAKFFHAVLFDGADDTGPQDVNIFIGKETETSKLDDKIDPKLIGKRAWPLRLAFFPSSDEDNPTGSAEYEMDLIAHDNGVISDISIEYPDFTVHQALTAVEKLEIPDCGER